MKNNVKKWINEDGIKFLKEIGLKYKQKVLDFGCGEGHYSIPASKIVGEKGVVFALDKDRDVLIDLQYITGNERLKNIKFINGESEIPIKDNSIDFILSYDVIHYEKRDTRKKIYNEFFRILKKEGIFSIYPKHYKEDYPLMELADVTLKEVMKNIKKSGFTLEDKILARLIHDYNFNMGFILNFKKRRI